MKLHRLTPEQRAAIVQLRLAGKSLGQIQAELGLKKEVVWYHIKRLQRPQLSLEERTRRILEGSRRAAQGKREAAQRRREARSDAGSDLWKRFAGEFIRLSPTRKGKVAEAAVLLRLILLGLDVYGPVHDCPSDWMVIIAHRRIRIQVKLARNESGGSLFIHNQRGRDARPYTSDECDFIIGYSLLEDACYVIPIAKARQRYLPLQACFKEQWASLVKQ